VLVETMPPVDATVPATRVVTITTEDGCRDRQYSQLSRFWELEAGSSCGTLGFRGYRPLSVGLGVAAQDPETATSPAPNHTGVDRPYQAQDMRIGLSLRTKLAQGLLTGDDPVKKDGLWFAYSQLSTWQVFNEDLSRPFRTTDHEPEVMYSYPLDYKLPGGWRLRYTGVGLAHQSNGQDLPYSRSWNRAYLMGGIELGDQFTITGRVWTRVSENAANDDNPDITKYLGNADLRVTWQIDRMNQVAAWAHGGKGAVRLEWFKVIGDPVRSNLRLQTQLFYGYGDTLVDYNRKRTVFTIGLALVDF
jgi:phospholipase A1